MAVSRPNAYTLSASKAMPHPQDYLYTATTIVTELIIAGINVV